MVFEGGRHLSGRKRLSWKRRRNTIRRRISSLQGRRKENSCHRGHVLYSVSPGRPQVPGNGRERRGKVPQDCAEASGGNETVSVGLCRYGNLKEKVYVFIWGIEKAEKKLRAVLLGCGEQAVNMIHNAISYLDEIQKLLRSAIKIRNEADFAARRLGAVPFLSGCGPYA